ncbi:MAG: hypothetical protein WAM39_31725 [Bryobacteraceae bacterium]
MFDSGLFLYVGEQLKQGLHLYRDVWDHKPPLIFVLNEIGLVLAGGSAVGVFVLDYTACFVFFAVSYAQLRNLFGSAVGFLSICCGILLFRDIAPHPNLGEVISLPAQAASFVLLLRDLDRGVSLQRASAQAVLFAMLFWTRPNGIAISIVCCAVTAISLVRGREPAALAKWAVTFLAVSAAASAVIVTPFAIASSWHEVWFATFTFNQLYAGLTTLGDRARALWWMIQFSAEHGMILLAAAGVVSILFWRRPSSEGVWQALRISVAWFALELIFAAYTGKQYGKNMIPSLFPAMLAIGAFFYFLTEGAAVGRTQASVIRALSSIISCFTVALSLGQFRENAKSASSPDDLVISRVGEMSSANDLVTFWGVFPPDTIFTAHRKAGTRFFSSVPLSHGEAAYRSLAPLLLDDLARRKPKLIVERSDGQIPPLLSKARLPVGDHDDWDTEQLAGSKARLMESYLPVWTDPESKTIIYRRQ